MGCHFILATLLNFGIGIHTITKFLTTVGFNVTAPSSGLMRLVCHSDSVTIDTRTCSEV